MSHKRLSPEQVARNNAKKMLYGIPCDKNNVSFAENDDAKFWLMCRKVLLWIETKLKYFKDGKSKQLLIRTATLGLSTRER
jgi:hypothetical protein